MDAMTYLRKYYSGKADNDGRSIDIVERIRDVCDRTRGFYKDMSAEMNEYLQSTMPEEDFHRKTNLSVTEFNRRLKMLGIERL